MRNRWMRLFVILPLLAASGCSMVNVRVIDDANGTAIPSANVAWTDTAGKAGSVATDWHGEAVVVAPGPVRHVRVTKEGYKPGEQDLSPDRPWDGMVEVRMIPLGADPSGFGK